MAPCRPVVAADVAAEVDGGPDRRLRRWTFYDEISRAPGGFAARCVYKGAANEDLDVAVRINEL